MATIQDFLNSLQSPQAAKQRTKKNSSVVDSLRNTAADMGTALTILPRQVMGQQISPEELQRAQSGSENLFSALTPAGLVATAPNVAQAGARTALPEIKNAGQKIVQDIDETMQVASAQPGGLQAGFAKIPRKGDLPPINNVGNKTSQYVASEKTGSLIKNPKLSKAAGGNDAGELPPAKLQPIEPVIQKQAKVAYTPHPDIADEPLEIVNRVNKNPLTQGNPVLVNLRDQSKKNLYYLEDMDRAQHALDKYVAGESALEVERNLPKVLTEESKRISNTIARQPKTQTIDTIIALNEKNMAKSGITPGISAKADTATGGLLKELQAQITAGSSDVVPTQADGELLMQYKKLLDKRLKSAYKKDDLGTALSPEENATLTMRRSIDELLTEMYPKSKEALQRQSALMDARTSVAKAADKEQENLLSALGKPQEEGFLKKHATAVLGATIPTAFAGGYGITQAAPKLAGMMSGDQANTDTAPLDPNAKPKYEVKTPLEDGTLMSEQTYAQRQAQLQQQLGQVKLTDPIRAAQLEQEIAANSTLFESQGNLRKIATDSRVVFDTANKVSQSLSSSPDTSWMNFVSGGYDEMAKANGGRYARLAADLKALEQASGVQIFGSTPRSKDAFAQGIDALVELQQSKMGALQQQFQGKGTQAAPAPIAQKDLPPIPQAPVNWQQQDPRVEAVLQGR